jgi:hypothetical protein
MTGFKLHCPPGFVDRAYLVFLHPDITHRTADYDGSESLSPPLRVRVTESGLVAGVRAPGRRTRPTASDLHLCGDQPGRSMAPMMGMRRPPEASGPVPPEEPAPYSVSRASRAWTPYPVTCRAGRMPLSPSPPHAAASGAQDIWSQTLVGRRRSGRVALTVPGASDLSPGGVTANPLRIGGETDVPQGSGCPVTSLSPNRGVTVGGRAIVEPARRRGRGYERCRSRRLSRA